MRRINRCGPYQVLMPSNKVVLIDDLRKSLSRRVMPLKVSSGRSSLFPPVGIFVVSLQSVFDSSISVEEGVFPSARAEDKEEER